MMKGRAFDRRSFIGGANNEGHKYVSAGVGVARRILEP